MLARPPLVAVVGPTAVGKTAISLRLAGDFGGEIVSADSRQIYRGLDIGTDKVSAADRAQVPHHLVDVVWPDQMFTVVDYQQAAYAAIDSVHARGRCPILVGGSGLYVRAVLQGLAIPSGGPDLRLRAELEARAEAQGSQALHAWLVQLDPIAAGKIDHRNVRRVVRALEVCLATGTPISQLQRATPPPYDVLSIGLTRPRQVLYKRIDQRVERMIAQGLVDEVRGLLDAGYSPELPALSGLGYRQVIRHLQGQMTLEDAIAAIKRQTRRFVRQQGTWFRLDDPQIHWFDLEATGYPAIAALLRDWLRGRDSPGLNRERSQPVGMAAHPADGATSQDSLN